MSTIPKNESMIVEFKNDLRRLSDRELIEAVVCMANAQGNKARTTKTRKATR